MASVKQCGVCGAVSARAFAEWYQLDIPDGDQIDLCDLICLYLFTQGRLSANMLIEAEQRKPMAAGVHSPQVRRRRAWWRRVWDAVRGQSD